ncbi:unnamed protein product [Polarella glacialis]|uniref:Peptidase M20 dimerisation domain-containing protein n=1 Tax=Polarella glacialis TaxID=89957 RepID=A0A813FG42_POLGL|nr:unnamed protein product [Polarella glacialis]
MARPLVWLCLFSGTAAGQFEDQFEAAGQSWANAAYGQTVKCCGSDLDMCTSSSDWSFCTAASCPNENGAVVPDKAPTLEGMCAEWYDQKSNGTEMNCLRADEAMANHLASTVASAAAGKYKGNVSDGACIWCDCCALLTSLCTTPNPEALRPYPWEVYSLALTANMTQETARLEMWRPASQRVSSEASLTTAMADFSQLPGMARDLDSKLYVDVLRRLIAESKFLQNNPRLGVTPEESRAVAVVLKELEAFSTKAGGPLVIEELEYVEGRANLKVTYPGSSKETVAFVGSHFDVVPADPEPWSKDPFQLTVEGDNLYGRGTTDCLGHVALLTCFLKELGRSKPKLKRSLVVLFIAAEEGGEKGVGVDACVKNGKLDEEVPQNGKGEGRRQAPPPTPASLPSSGPRPRPRCRRKLRRHGVTRQEGFKPGFSMPNMKKQRMNVGAYAVFVARHLEIWHHLNKKQWNGSFNQICPETTVHGDIRLSPFYEVETVVERGDLGDYTSVERYVKDVLAALVQAFRETNAEVKPFSEIVKTAIAEVIRKAKRSALYFDLEYYRECNTHAESLDVMQAFHELLLRFSANVLGVQIQPGDVVVLKEAKLARYETLLRLACPILPAVAALVLGFLAASYFVALPVGSGFLAPMPRAADSSTLLQESEKPQTLPVDSMMLGAATGLLVSQPAHATMLYDEILPYAGATTGAILWGLVLGFVLLRLQEAVPE